MIVSIVEDHKAMQAFAREHLRECAEELLEWSDTGRLRDGRVRELARMCWWGQEHYLQVAENTIKCAALEFVVEKDAMNIDLAAENRRLRRELEALRRKAARFDHLQNAPVVEAQAFFWNYSSRSARAKAIDRAINGKELV